MTEPTPIPEASPSPAVKAHNAVYNAGWNDGWNTRDEILKVRPARSMCAWCGLIILASSEEHIRECDRAPYRADLARLRDYEGILGGQYQRGEETLLATLARLKDEAQRWRTQRAAKKAPKKATP